MQKTRFYLFNVGMLIPVLCQVLWVRCLKLFPRQKCFLPRLNDKNFSQALCKEGLNGVKRVAWNIQKINRVSWKRGNECIF